MGEPRDAGLNETAVRAYRDQFRLCPNLSRRQEIVSTVKDLDLWQSVLNEWKERKWSPFKINWMLSEYERREKSANGTNAGNGRSSERKRSPKDMQVRVSEWRSSNLSCVPENAGVRFRASSKTLEEIVTEALQSNNRFEAEVEP